VKPDLQCQKILGTWSFTLVDWLTVILAICGCSCHVRMANQKVICGVPTLPVGLTFTPGDLPHQGIRSSIRSYLLLQLHLSPWCISHPTTCGISAVFNFQEGHILSYLWAFAHDLFFSQLSSQSLSCHGLPYSFFF
jgi:hypothetical protein